MYEHTYWNSNGPEQAKYDEMEAAAFKYTKATLAVFRAYYRYYNDGSANPRGNFGSYWSSRPSSNYAYYLDFYDGNSGMNDYNRANGYSVRCVQATD